MGWDMGGSFKSEGAYVYLCLIHVDAWQKPEQYCKAIIQLKKKKKTWCREAPKYKVGKKLYMSY